MTNPASTVAWIFPGQGSQKVGSGRDLYEASPAARRVFQRADAALGFLLSELCFHGPENILRQTINAQPAIMAVSLACLEAAHEAGLLPSGQTAAPRRGPIQARLGEPAFVAGHSLGEYSALVAAGALDIEDGLRLVRERGRLMQMASEEQPGTMAAILGLDEETAAALCRETGAQVCNLNAPGQIVIGGTLAAVEAALDLARQRGARRAIPLNVSGAFHTDLMTPAVKGMARALERVALRDPQVPVLANGSARPLTSARQVRDELLYQLDHPVQWQRSVEYMASAGVDTFIELGPGQVLTGLVSRIVPGARLINIDGVAAIQAARAGAKAS
jgi:[acyl-carrier-protein] S-malonyltransferase